MAVSPLLLLELALYSSCFICGIITAASLTIVQGHFGGLCLLYGRVSYNATANTTGVQASSSVSLCYFVSAISIMVAVVCFSMVLSWVYTLCTEGGVRRERVWMNLVIAVSGVFLFFLLVTGCVLKVGRDSLCDSIRTVVPNVSRCDEAQSRKWAKPLQGDKFYSDLHKAETAVWVNFFLWLIIGVLVFVQQRQSSGAKLVPAPAGALFGDSSVTPAETEPFFNQPPRPQ
ncbi:transmembrane protein 179B [Kryptolebias marmoratus]|uniref:Transmembrane protein 179Ba n=1 Tax=Kryptolebias marmoratus TaxID=37003 RepID=A0A3Q3A2M8_KRYMA|nr:transmembrane protein 179B [Kryptolebias marmoratus]